METKDLTSNRGIVFGWFVSSLAILFLLSDSVGKLIKPEAVVAATLELGYPEGTVTGMGIVLLISTLLYAIPRFSFTGALLLTGYLGGAVATHVRVESPLFSHTLFPVYIAVFIWGGLYLRNKKLREIVINKK
ncbi:DoxX family protein [Maribellus maritimus]|uniref:DoxX family protein n=1 Tax=Maribellus maritimus TaxID=2870838 RepID=UPI001EEA2B25|nr:DoxX family protein [Maribellus maritimus]MCG6185891.1 DoxX family protein [Maribellus maritimus]